jgi:hypothetical protein
MLQYFDCHFCDQCNEIQIYFVHVIENISRFVVLCYGR